MTKASAFRQRGVNVGAARRHRHASSWTRARRFWDGFAMSRDESLIVPILPLRNSVVFPASVVPINVGRPRSVRLVDDIVGEEKAVLGIVTQKRPDIDDPRFDELNTIGTLARVVRVIRLGSDNYSVVVHGIGRMRLVEPISLEPYARARYERIPDDLERTPELDTKANDLRTLVRKLLPLVPNLPKELAQVVDNVREPGTLADLITANLAIDQLTLDEKQAILETLDPLKRIERVTVAVHKHLDILSAKHKVSAFIAEEGRREREELLRQQMQQIKSELGEEDEEEIDELRERVRKARMPDDVLRLARKQIARMTNMSSQSGEYNVARTYVEWLADMPWSNTTPETLDVEATRRCLDEDHFGLEKVKKRILEFVAVRKLRADKKGPILCFIGPPGVGKTSLGRSIARSMGRHYHRIALGGVRDEAEIRGHRRTYVGALPGRIVQALKKVQVKNPVLVLDEIEKLGIDNAGDPASALLEVLDPAQNDTFQDHYLDVPFDLSQVVFLCTANDEDRIPDALHDRLEIIHVPGYTRAEKLAIAKQHLIPKNLSNHGLTDERLEFTDDGIIAILEGYTREAGVRGLEREIGGVCRHAAMRIAEGSVERIVADREAVEEILGPSRQGPDLAERTMVPGVSTGLAWTPSGGDILFIEASKMPGRGAISVTGNLKSVMSESAHTAMTFVRSRAERLGLAPDFLKDIDIHLHVPKGGTPKDGPSAGIAMFSAITSLLLGCALKGDVAMTGEITLRGAVLPVGGIKEKLLAAHRAGIKTVLVPEKNRADLDDVPKEVREALTIHLVSRVDEVLPLVLDPASRPPAPPPSLEAVSE
jgi:ATP-dependent Lon protease